MVASRRQPGGIFLVSAVVVYLVGISAFAGTGLQAPGSPVDVLGIIVVLGAQIFGTLLFAIGLLRLALSLRKPDPSPD